MLKVDPADVKPSVLNFLVIGVMVLVFLVAAKILTRKVYIPGLTEVVAMA